MKRIHWISAIALTSGLLLSVGLIRSDHWVVRSQGAAKTATATEEEWTPLRYTLRLLRVAAEPLAYLPIMRQAVAAPQPTQAANPQLLEDAEVTLTGVGPLRIGMTVEEAADALGLPLVPLGSDPSGECAYYQPNLKGQSLGLMAVEDQVIRIDIWPGSTLETPSGAHIGSSEADILAIYPKQIESAPNPYTQGKFLTFVPTDPSEKLYRIVFETDANGRVVQYRTGQFPAVTWPDGCA